VAEKRVLASKIAGKEPSLFDPNDKVDLLNYYWGCFLITD
jgi:hypothetical protein